MVERITRTRFRYWSSIISRNGFLCNLFWVFRGWNHLWGTLWACSDLLINGDSDKHEVNFKIFLRWIIIRQKFCIIYFFFFHEAEIDNMDTELHHILDMYHKKYIFWHHNRIFYSQNGIFHKFLCRPILTELNTSYILDIGWLFENDLQKSLHISHIGSVMQASAHQHEYNYKIKTRSLFYKVKTSF